MCISLIYFFSVSDMPEETYGSIHMCFIVSSIIAFSVAVAFKIPSIATTVFVTTVSYIVINNIRNVYGEDYVFSAGYNIWCLLLFPNLLISYFIYIKDRPYHIWNLFFIIILIETAFVEQLQKQQIDADSYFFYKHIGMFNYPAISIALICILILVIQHILNGKIMSASVLTATISIFIGIFLSDNLLAYSLFFCVSSCICLITSVYYAYYKANRDEQLNIENTSAFIRASKNKYPMKYSLSLLYIDEYERILKRFGENKTVALKKMLIKKIRQTTAKAMIYSYKSDAVILAFKNMNATETFEIADEIRRTLAKSIFIYDENNNLQLTVSQCISEKKRSDGEDASNVLLRAETNLQKACQFTRNITIKA